MRPREMRALAQAAAATWTTAAAGGMDVLRDHLCEPDVAPAVRAIEENYPDLRFVACGGYRCVFMIASEGVVIKLPRNNKGADDNLRERQRWELAVGEDGVRASTHRHLAPVLDVADDGSWLLMRQATLIEDPTGATPTKFDRSSDDFRRLLDAAKDIGVKDTHLGNLGRIEDDLVWVDYALNPRGCRCGLPHPRLGRPIPERQFADELGQALRQVRLPRATLTFAAHVSDRHARTGRSYAEVQPETAAFFFAPEVLWLPREHRTGLIYHEIGHVLAPDGGEDDADAAAGLVLGPIYYDLRWPGKGLQTVVPPPDCPRRGVRARMSR